MSNTVVATPPSLHQVLDNVKLVVCSTRMVTPVRDTGQGRQDGARIEKVLQTCFDPSALRPLGSLKTESARLCRNYGSKVESLNAWAVPNDRVDELLDQLKELQQRWSQRTLDLADAIHETVSKWAQHNPEQAESIWELAPTRDDVIQGTRFIFTSFQLRGDDVTDGGCLSLDLSDLSNQALHEFSVMIRDAKVDRNESGAYSGKVRDVLDRVAVKARSFAFLNPLLREIAATLDELVRSFPSNGSITGVSALAVRSVIDLLVDPVELKRKGLPKIATPAEEKKPLVAVQTPASTQLSTAAVKGAATKRKGKGVVTEQPAEKLKAEAELQPMPAANDEDEESLEVQFTAVNW